MQFTESQQFPDWLRYGLVLMTLVTMYLMFIEKTHILLSVSGSIILTIVAATFFFWNLQTTINSQAITIEIKPFVKKIIPLKDIEDWEVRRYGPIAEFGGWGVRFSGNGTAYNVRGSIGLDTEITSGKKLLIGTQKGEEIKRLLRSKIPDKEREMDTSG